MKLFYAWYDENKKKKSKPRTKPIYNYRLALSYKFPREKKYIVPFLLISSSKKKKKKITQHAGRYSNKNPGHAEKKLKTSRGGNNFCTGEEGALC